VRRATECPGEQSAQEEQSAQTVKACVSIKSILKPYRFSGMIPATKGSIAAMHVPSRQAAKTFFMKVMFVFPPYRLKKAPLFNSSFHKALGHGLTGNRGMGSLGQWDG